MKRYLALAAALLLLLYLMQIVPAFPAEANTSDDYGWIKQEVVYIPVTTAGGLGAGTGSGDTDAIVRGHIYAVHLKFPITGSIPVDTDVTISATSGPVLTLMTLTNTITDSWYYPVATQTGSTGTSTSTYDRMPINSQVHIAIANTYPITGYNVLTATILWGQ